MHLSIPLCRRSTLTLCLCALWIWPAQAATLRIGTWDRKSDVPAHASEAVLLQAYSELHQPVEFVEMPIRRALELMLRGDIDGNLYRIGELEQEQPTLFRVKTPISAMEIRIYAPNTRPHINHWSQLANLRVAYQRGALQVERNLPANSHLVEAASVDEEFRMVSQGVADIALVVEAANTQPHSHATPTGLIRQDGAIGKMPLYHYLLGKHRALGLRLNAVLARMANSGEMRAIQKKATAGQD